MPKHIEKGPKELGDDVGSGPHGISARKDNIIYFVVILVVLIAVIAMVMLRG